MTTDDTLLDLLDWNRPPEDQAHALALAQRAGDLAAFIQPCTARHNKNVWENCARVLCARTDAELAPHLPRLLCWLQDMNWPGARRILDRLRRFSDREALAAALDLCLKRAREDGDDEWSENLRLLVPQPD